MSGRELERFRAKACPALDAGWVPVRVKKTRQNERLELPFRFNGTEGLGTIWLSDFLFAIGGAFGLGLPVAILIIWISS
jgi:hypothetical protein